jgi:hypothetical protein
MDQEQKLKAATDLLRRCSEGFGAFINGRKMVRYERDKLRRDIADFLDGVRVSREHDASADCWCGPEVAHKDPDTGACVYVHKEMQ